MHFERDYSGTAWIHSLVDCTTMLCGKETSYLTLKPSHISASQSSSLASLK